MRCRSGRQRCNAAAPNVTTGANTWSSDSSGSLPALAPCPLLGSPLDEAIARVAVVVDAVLFLKLLNVPELTLRVRARNSIAEWLVGVQKNFFKATRHAQPLVLGEIVEQGGKSLLQAHGHIHALDLQRFAGVEQVMSEFKLVSVEIPYSVIAQSLVPVAWRHHDVDSCSAMELVELVGISDDEID